MKRMTYFTVCLAVLGFFMEFSPKAAEAIPAFARKYKTACTTCHATFPRLTALGEAFRLNGYKMPEADELYVKDEPLSLGAEAYKKVFPDAVWPDSIPGMPPLALRVVSVVNMATGGTTTNRTDFSMPDELALLAGGSMGTDLSFFVEVAIGDTSNERTAWIMWENLFGDTLGKKHLNIKVGNVGRHEIALPNTRTENRISHSDYLYVDELELATRPGFELNGFGKRWRYAVGAVQPDDPQNSAKDYFGNFAIKLGGLGYDGSGGWTEEGGLKTSPSGYWRDDAVLLGVFGYRSFIGPDWHHFDRMGADLRVNYKDLSLAGGYIKGKNDDTLINKNITFAEAEYFVYPWLQPYVRYEILKVDGENSTGDDDQSRIVAGAVLLARANFKMIVEDITFTKNEPAIAAGGKKSDNDEVSLRFDFAF